MVAFVPKPVGLPASILLCGLFCALPVSASAELKAKATAKKPPSEISIENGRKVALNSFEIVFIEPEPRPGAKPKPPHKPVLKLEEPLGPGETKTLKLTGAKGCAYVARWAFADAGDEGQIDLCGDPKIVLTD